LENLLSSLSQRLIQQGQQLEEKLGKQGQQLEEKLGNQLEEKLGNQGQQLEEKLEEKLGKQGQQLEEKLVQVQESQEQVSRNQALFEGKLSHLSLSLEEINPSRASSQHSSAFTNLLDNMRLQIERDPTNPQVQHVQLPSLSKWEFSWQDLTMIREDLTHQQLADIPLSAAAGYQSTNISAECTDTGMTTDAKMKEDDAYEPVREYLANVFSDYDVMVVAHGQDIGDGRRGILFETKAFTSRQLNPWENRVLEFYVSDASRLREAAGVCY